MQTLEIGRIRIKERDSQDWNERARCLEMAREARAERGVDGHRDVINFFFPTRHEGPEDVEKAKSVCFNECPVRAECITYAILNYEKVGIWGGLGEKERRVLRREMRARGLVKKDMTEEEKSTTLQWVKVNRHKIGRKPALSPGRTSH